ncbi:MAG: hypothetical protein E7418_02110 [Ruminococcaceae bacterium]|nr:hypothetical protein [Oscillospiraceae bacterium]
MHARELVEKTFIAPFVQKKKHFVGTELEFPLICSENRPIDMQVIEELLTYLLHQGFSVEETDINGRGVFLVNADGDCLSFDNSYNNFEFAMEKAVDLSHIANRFYKLYALVQNFLRKHGHSLCGCGTNPNYAVAELLPVEYPVYRTIRGFLERFSGNDYHSIPYFPAWLSSVQTHLDVSEEQLPQALTCMAELDFARGLLFSNGLPLVHDKAFEKTVCFRDYLWEKSGFGSLQDNTGPVCGEFVTCDDIVDMILKKSMFLKKQGNDFVTMEPVPLEAYFDGGAPESNIAAYLSFKNVEVTRRGTLEMRSDCAQPLGAAFAPPAFNLGLVTCLEETRSATARFFEKLLPELFQSPERNMILRRKAIYGELDFAEHADISAFLCELVAIAEQGLRQRGYGEETLLAPLYHRAKTLTCPAKIFRDRLQDGEEKNAILEDFSNPEKVF